MTIRRVTFADGSRAREELPMPLDLMIECFDPFQRATWPACRLPSVGFEVLEYAVASSRRPWAHHEQLFAVEIDAAIDQLDWLGPNVFYSDEA